MICNHCQQEFTSKFNSKFCSYECRYRFQNKKIKDKNRAGKEIPTELECPHCQEKFSPNPLQVLQQRFCSKRCKSEWHKQRLREETAEQRQQIVLKCKVCDKEFNPGKTLRQNKYCSAKCRNLFPKKCYKALRTCYQYLGETKRDRAHKLLGYSPRQLQDHIQNHPNWLLVKDEDWHLDHIFPIIAFLDAGIRDVSLMCCLENLQPLAGQANMQKNDSYDPILFESWLKSQN